MGEAFDIISSIMSVIGQNLNMLSQTPLFGDFTWTGIIITFFIIELVLDWIFELFDRAWDHPPGRDDEEGSI